MARFGRVMEGADIIYRVLDGYDRMDASQLRPLVLGLEGQIVPAASRIRLRSVFVGLTARLRAPGRNRHSLRQLVCWSLHTAYGVGGFFLFSLVGPTQCASFIILGVFESSM